MFFSWDEGSHSTKSNTMLQRFIFFVVLSLFSISAFSQGKSVPQNLRVAAQHSVSVDKASIQKKTQAQQKSATTQQSTKQQVQSQGQYVPRARQITRWQPCQTCGGTGRCMQCNGIGYHSIEYSAHHQGVTDCGACHRSGICQVCNGLRGHDVYDVIYE